MPAVPNIESWILSDPKVFASFSNMPLSDNEKKFQDYIADTGFRFLNQREKARLASRATLKSYDALRAAMLSPSLRWFINVTDNNNENPRGTINFDINKALLSNLVLEYFPQEQPIFRTLDGAVYTGYRMSQEIAAGSEIGRKYSSDLLRVCRDLLARQAQKSVA